MTRLRHLALRYLGMQRLRAFCEQVIGLQFVAYRCSRRGLRWSSGVNNLTLIEQSETCRRQTLREGDALIHFGIVVDDPQQVRERLRVWGVRSLCGKTSSCGCRFSRATAGLPLTSSN